MAGCYAHAHANSEHDHQASCQADTDAEVWQVLNKGQAVRVAQLAGRYQKAAMALCAEAAGTTPGHKGPRIQARVAATRAFTMTDIAWTLVCRRCCSLASHPLRYCDGLVLARRMHYS